MTHSNSVHTGGCCCHRIVVQCNEIKSELQNIRQTVDVAVKLLSESKASASGQEVTPCFTSAWVTKRQPGASCALFIGSKLVSLTPDDMQTLLGVSGDSTASSVPDCLSVVSGALRRNSPKKITGISIGQTAVVKCFPTCVKSRAENVRTKFDKVSVEDGNDGTSTEDDNMKSAVDVVSDKSVSTKTSTVEGTGSDNDVQLNVSAESSTSLSEHLITFVRTSCSTSPLPAGDITEDHSIVSGNMVTSKHQTVVSDHDIAVGAKSLEPQNKKTDNTLLADTVPANASGSVSASQADCVKTVVANTEACVDGVMVKEEQSSEHDGDDLTIPAVTMDERLQESEDVKMEPEGVFISDALLPVCVLVKKEEGFYANNIQESNVISLAGSHSTEQNSEQNSVTNTGDKLSLCSRDQTIGHVMQDSPYQITSPLRPLLGSALVSKLKQKIQEKIQAAVCVVDEGTRVDEDGSANVMNTNTCMEMSHSFNKDSINAKELTVTQSKCVRKFYQCKSCAKIFFCKITLRMHKNHCRGLQKQYHCSLCPLMFKSRAVLFSHRRLHSAKKSKHRHKCEICGREFILKSTLKQHKQSQVCKRSRMKCYRKLPQHFCNQCGEGFLNSSNLELHQKIHEVGETHSNSSAVEGTGPVSRGSSVYIPRAVRRYPCTYCDEAFIDRRSVALHEKLHTDKEFATFDEERKMILRRHQLTMMFQKQQQQQQSNRKKFGCEVCGRCYSIELLLHMHTRLHHAIS